MTLRLISLAFTALIAACGGSGSDTVRENASSSILELASVRQQVAGKPAVYLFTAPGCGSCADQARALASAARSKPSVLLVGVDLANDSPHDFASYISAIGLAQSPFIWTIDRDRSLARQYGIVSLSSSVFVGSDGSTRFINHGPADAQTLVRQLNELA